METKYRPVPQESSRGNAKGQKKTQNIEKDVAIRSCSASVTNKQNKLSLPLEYAGEEYSPAIDANISERCVNLCEMVGIREQK